jgi:dTDP-4-amino-4,6-dideoxygalactose transaminase
MPNYIKSNKTATERILVTRSSMPTLDEYVDELRSIWDTHWMTNMGNKHEKLRKELKEYLDVENIDLFTNGHSAIEMTLQAMNLQGEVITTPFTFASTTHAIVRNGLTPVFCDIDPKTYCMDPEKIENLITDRTCAIMPVHVYGNVCEVEEIQRIANKYGLKVVYDACHTFGEKVKIKTADGDQWVGVGTFGDASCFSFHATKVYNTIEGGAVCFKDQHFGETVHDLKNFGIHGPEDVWNVGGNAKMNEFCAAMGLCNLRHVDEWIEQRKQVVEHYRERLGDVPGIQLNPVQENVKSNYAYFPVVFEPSEFGSTRNEVFDALAKENIGARKYFYPLTNTFECFHGEYDVEKTPIALRISKRVLTLPLYADLEVEDVDRICDIVLSCRK